MTLTFRDVVVLLKLRIGVAIAASALAGMAAAAGPPVAAWRVAALAVAVIGASGAAGAFNHYYERDIDARMKRTQRRPFASGVLPASAWWVVSFAALLVASLALAWVAAGAFSAVFVFAGAFTYGIVYTVWLKRRSVLNIVVGGLAGSFAVLAGAAAVEPSLQPVPVILALILFLWTPPHFWSLAALAAKDYAEAGIPMLPVSASARVWSVAIFGHVVALFVLSFLPCLYGFGPVYGVLAMAGAGIFLWRSGQLAMDPTPVRARASFLASLLQLWLLTLGVVADGLLERLV